MSNELLTTQLKKPTIYAYSDIRYNGKLKVGYTATKTAEERVREQYPVKTPSQSWTLLLDEPAIREDGSFFTDHDVHRTLKKHGIERDAGEWFDCDIKAVQAALMEIRTGKPNIEHRTQSFKMRPEQQEAVERTAQYFTNIKQEEAYRNKEPHFLWNAKMRFGKTFTAYQLAKKMGWKKILILTFKPAVHNAWQEDLENHIDFEGWQFVSNNENTLTYEEADKTKPIVCFGSFQDYLGKNKATGGIKTKNEWVHATNWDCVIFDEYHYGAWRETAKDLFDNDEAKGEQEYALSTDLKNFDEELLPITTEHYLYLSGTPFRALNSGEFIEEQIYNWTYSDEQKAKEEWATHSDEPNPYASLPKMVMMTYQLPDAVKTIAQQGEFNEFDLNEFFFAEGTGKDAKFKHEEYVQKWLDLMRNALPDAYVDSLKLGRQKPPMPFSDVNLLGNLLHTFWFLPSVASCDAMENLLKQRQNVFYQDYQIVNASGTKAGIGSEAIPPVKRAMGENPLASKSITLSCGKLTTGVSIAPWTGILMLRNMTSPEGYFQAAFRVQTPWVMRGHNPNDPNNEEIIKEQCYVFDFAPTRALRQISDYSCRLNVGEQSPERKVEEFIQFLPVLAYDGSSMRQIDAAGVLDIAMQGTTATLLAKRWESALLVNVDNFTLQRFLDNDEAMQTLQKIEGFRSINKDIETIINRSNEVKKSKKDKNDDETMSKTEKDELTAKEKEMKGLRKQIQEKLIKFATRIPIFMYLTDYREHTLHDVITQLEPQLFERVTGLTQADFRLLVNLNLFNESLMNDAVYKFKRYEDASTSYHTMDWERHETVFLYNTEVSRELLEKN
ncbi:MULTISPECIES: DEAD/DEAH box helicase family protein [unclassified Acinetobacter]|uniref:DEAD/DEAH box helicase family protein n=1 Tax=unclassified Acinetobacter TaxID=196816 RepID=UPI0015D21839|nr:MULTISPECIES: DEAD/DEAH box helicase family protein [unclassified Acinetobacter]